MNQISSHIKEAAIYLAILCVRKPNHMEWENALRIVSGRKGQKLTKVEIGKLVMQAQFDFQDGITDEFLARELPPPPPELFEPTKEEKDAPRRNKKSPRGKRGKQVR
jgi:hypothetical protein